MVGGVIRRRDRGFPTSSNRASSFHLRWDGAPPLLELSVTLEIVEVPRVRRLYFWALQASFAGLHGVTGGAHLGLQWHAIHPGGTAANFGGYDSSGRELEGSKSSLPSRPGNSNTRDYTWRAGQAYRLTISPAGPGWWSGEVTDLASGSLQQVRTLAGGGEHLLLPMVWSEVFARCDDPPVVVAWSDPNGTTLDGRAWRPSAATVTYQPLEEGGCSNTDVTGDGVRLYQRTSVPRRTPHGSALEWGQDRLAGDR